MSDHQGLSEPLLEWLLDPADPGPRYLALRDLLDMPADHPDLASAREQAHAHGPIADTLGAMEPDGHWVEPGPGYTPKYRSTVWSVVSLAQLGASAAVDERIERGCEYVLAHTLADGAKFSASRGPAATADCLQGNLCAALLDLGVQPERLEGAFDWMARTVTGEGLASSVERGAPQRYYAGKCGPLFACGSHNRTSCAWGGVKVMQAFAGWPEARRTPLIDRAVEAGVEFFLASDPVDCLYPRGYSPKPNGGWCKFGFPVFYVADVLQLADALVSLGYGGDPRFAHTLEYIESKRDADGRWTLELDYAGKTWSDYGEKKRPNMWVTLRALRVLKRAGRLGR